MPSCRTCLLSLMLSLMLAVLSACGGGTSDTTPPHVPSGGAPVRAGAAQASDYNEVLQRIFVAYFGRPADPAGLAYWAGQWQAAGMPTTVAAVNQSYSSSALTRQLIDVFGTSQESRDLYPGDNDAFITAIYHNILNREPDPAGKAYWADLINTGRVTRPIAAIAIMAGAQLSDITIINNKTAVATRFTAALNTPARVNGYDGNSASAAARAMLGGVGVTTDPASFQSTVEATINTLASQPVVKLAIDKPAVTFAQQEPGTSSAAQLITLRNAGTVPIGNLGISYPLGPNFRISSSCGTSLEVGASCTITASFTPNQYWVNNDQSRSSTLSISSNQTAASVTLTGSVPPRPLPALRVSPGALSFAAQTLGTSSAGQSVTLTNTGSAPLNFSCIDTPRVNKPTDCYILHTENIGLPYDYSYTTTCRFDSRVPYPPTDVAPYLLQPVANLAPGASCSVTVVFKPSTSGLRSGLLILDSDAASGAAAPLALSGSGNPATPVLDTYSPSSTLQNQSTTFTFTGSNLISGMVFKLSGCLYISELAGGSGSQRQFSCTPTSSGTLTGTLSANGSVLGSFTVSVTAVSTPPPGSGADYSTSFSIDESSEASFILTDRNPRHLSTSDTFTLTKTEQVWAFTAAQYAVNIYALDATNATRFNAGQSFSGYLLCSESSTGMCFPVLPAGKYWIGTVPAQTVNSGYSNPVYHEVSTNHVLPKWRSSSDVSMFAGGNNGHWKSQGFTIGNGDVRAFIETEGYGGKFMVMSPSQYQSFAASYPNGFFSGSYGYTYACGGKTGGADTEIECELKLPPGSYYLVYINDTGSWAGGAANIEFYVPQ